MLMRMFSFHFMLPSNLLKVIDVVGLWGWTAVSLSASSLLMFIRCSSKEPGYVKASEGIRNNADAEGPLVKIDLINSANWTGNWSQLCPTCKIGGCRLCHWSTSFGTVVPQGKGSVLQLVYS
ncbi:putative protein S-acyltransferase [Helianthus annuus]|uniref:Uncharacterized protein n=1 Tax=Helianthus annuus TaxID=4232 RepID=A0A9K3DKY0_HELAN|nr:putative protein S-acyltransferase [Helianthus annuus]KAJ0429504.1 putative protein S-acyltransferase [Helianthus annuus]KAJ0636629.1 putative protein S-acyltransferase [Helianthus annuus]